MNNPIIEASGISKRYRISHSSVKTRSIREDITQAFKHPVKRVLGHTDKKEDFWALKDVGFSVNQGESLGIVGRNGSGKSTLLKILSRIVEPTEGQIILRGKVASLLEVGTGFHPELTGRENIFLNGSILGMSQREIKSKFNDIVEFSEIEQFLDTPVKFYSSGMYVRLAFAVAAHLDPDILIVDEVLAVGDAQFQEKCISRMNSIAKQGKTVLFVSHNMALVRSLCSRGLLLKEGHATAFDDIDELAAAYLARSRTTEKGKGIVIKAADLTFSQFTMNGKLTDGEIIIPSGEPITVEAKYTDVGKSKDLLIGFGLKHTVSGNFPVFTHNKLENVIHKSSHGGWVKAELIVPKLAPGIYSLEIHVWTNGEMLIADEEVCKFRILETPSFASQQLLSSFPSSILIDSKWEFNSKE